MFWGYQSPGVTGTQNMVLHIILICQDTFWKTESGKHYVATARANIFFKSLWSKSYLTPKKEAILFALSVATSKHQKSYSICIFKQFTVPCVTPPSLHSFANFRPLEVILPSSSTVCTGLNETMWGSGPFHIWQHLFTLVLRPIIKQILAKTKATHKFKPGGDWMDGGEVQDTLVYNFWHVKSPQKQSVTEKKHLMCETW